MRPFVRFLFWLAAIIAMLLLIGAFLPGQAHVSRSIEIKAPSSQVYAVLNDLKTYKAWMKWNQLDTAMKVEFSPVTEGVGAYYTWESHHKKVGTGKITITESVPYKKVNTSIVFGGFDRASEAGWDLEEKDGLTKLTWTMHSELSHNPVNRWFGLFLDKLVGTDFENGLSQLKEKIENGTLKKAEPALSLETIKRPAMLVLTILDTAQVMTDIGPKLQKSFGEMGQLLKSTQLTMQGPPMAWFYTDKEPLIMEAAVSVDKIPPHLSSHIRIRKVPAGNALVVHYYGPYEKLDIAYDRVREWLELNKAQASGGPYEVYVDDPATKKSMYEVRTDVVQPLK